MHAIRGRGLTFPDKVRTSSIARSTTPTPLRRCIKRSFSGVRPTWYSMSASSQDRAGIKPAATNNSQEGENEPLLTQESRSNPDYRPSSELTQPSQGSTWRLVLLGLLLVTAVVAVATGGVGPALLEAVEEAVADGGASGATAAAIFVALYVVATVLLFPASVLTLAAGALFGPLKGTALVSLASTLGAAAAFLVSRYLARPLVEERLRGMPKMEAMMKGISAQGTYLVFLLRLSPLFPFNLLNYGLGVTSVGFWQYVGASWLGMLPGTFAYVFLGGAGAAAAGAAGGSGLEPVKLVLYGVGAVATIAVTKLASSAASKALSELQEGGQAEAQ